jgi:uncharacterized oligopeptide transporter (OPT) family protein
VTDPVALALIAAVVTLASLAIPLLFGMWTIYKKAADAETAAKRSAEVVQENKVTVEVAAKTMLVKTDLIHEMFERKLDDLRQETGAGRADAAERYEKRLAETTGTP